MTTESIRRWCLALPGVTEDIKWDDDLLKAGLTKKAQAAIDAAPTAVRAVRRRPRG
jgi:predicted DNA-binding protein (MmcQ/YjbR family)